MKDYMTSEIFNNLKQKAQKNRFESSDSRIERLQKLSLWIKKNESLIEQALKADFNKPDFETQITEIVVVQAELKHFIQNLSFWMKDKKVPTPISLVDHASLIRFESKGVILIIAPWNYPFHLAIMPLIAALAAGNTVILKPSELTPATSNLIQKMCEQVFQKDEVIVELGGKEKTEELLSYDINHVFFTGSTAVGRIIAKSCAERLIPYTLELGGKSPAIVDSTANISEAVKKIHWGKFLNRGQTCVAPDIIYLHKNIKTEFLRLFKERNNKINADSPSQIINSSHEERLSKLAGRFIDFETEYTFLIDLSDQKIKNKSIETEEIFGPFAIVYEFETIADIEKIYKKNKNPLSLYIFSENNEFIDKALNTFPSGGVGINTLVVQLANHNLPFGGIGNSGQGKYHGYFGFLECSHQRAVIEQKYIHFSLDLLFPPYSKRKLKFIEALKKLVT